MSLITCPECGSQVSDKAVSCPKCGYPIAASVEKESGAEPAVAQNVVQNRVEKSPAEEPILYDEEPQGGKMKKFLLVFLAVIVVFGAVRFFFSKKSKGFNDNVADSTMVKKGAQTTAEVFDSLKAAFPDLKFTASGLAYRELGSGSGDKPVADQEVVFDYKMENLKGEVIDENKDFKNNTSQLIAGLKEGILLMSPGSEYIFYIPANLAYEDAHIDRDPLGFLICTVKLKEIVSKDFIKGGVTYTGVEIKDNAGINGDEHSETTYTLQCFNDGTMTWHQVTTFHNGYEFKYQGKWKKNTGSKYDHSYVWYEFWGDTYDIHMNKHYQMIGFVDEQGRLYDKFSVEDPVMAIYNNNSVCQLKAQ